MLIPLRDENPTRNTPYLNYALVAANALIFIYELTLSPKAQAVLAATYGTVPSRFVHALSGHGNFESAVLPLFTSMFLHNGPAHLLGNMLFLWIFGDNVEDFFGHFGYFFFYVACGVGAGLLHVLFNLHSNVPALGASGAISGVMGSYILLYPRAKVLTLVFIFPLPVPAVIFLGLWYVMQFLSGINALGVGASGGVAWWAHIGGFLLGMLFTGMLRRR